MNIRDELIGPDKQASPDKVVDVNELAIRPCPFCGKQPQMYWDDKHETDESLNEGFNLLCCNGIHIMTIFKNEGFEIWNQRAL